MSERTGQGRGKLHFGRGHDPFLAPRKTTEDIKRGGKLALSALWGRAIGEFKTDPEQARERQGRPGELRTYPGKTQERRVGEDRTGPRAVALRAGTRRFPRHKGVTKVCPIRPEFETTFTMAPCPRRIRAKEPERAGCQAIRSKRNELTIRVC